MQILTLKRYLPVVIICLAAVLTIAVYARSLNGPLISDDVIFINEERLQNLSGSLYLGSRSIAQLSFALNYKISGMSLTGFRIGNILLHLLTSLIVYLLVHLTLTMPLLNQKTQEQREIIPLAAAVLFMVHPIQTGAVNYITQRMAIMAALFSFLGLFCYAKAAISSGWKTPAYYGASATAFIIAVFSKENAVMALFMIPLYDLVFISSFRLKQFGKRFAALLLLSAAVIAIAQYKMNIIEGVREMSSMYLRYSQGIESYGWSGVGIFWTPVEHLMTEFRIVVRYLFLLIFPIPSFMVFDYSNAYPISKGLFQPVSTFLSLLFLTGLLFFALRYLKRFPLICFGILWFLITISLESFIAIGLDPYFEHRNYLPGFGIFLAAGACLSYVPAEGFKIRKDWLIAALSILLLIFTFVRNGVWADEERFWKDIVEKVPRNPRALLTTGFLDFKEGRYKEAEGYFKTAETLDHLSDQYRGLILINLAGLFTETGRYSQAEEYLTKAASKKEVLDSYKTLLLINRASLSYAIGKKDEAQIILAGLASEANLGPYYNAQVLYRLGEIYRAEGRLKEALEAFRKAHSINPNDASVLISLGIVSRASGNMNEAIDYFRKSMKTAPGQYAGYIELGDTYFISGQMDRAESVYKEVIAKSFDLPKQYARKLYVNLGQLKMAKKETNEAIQYLEKAIKADAGFYQPYLYLGDIYLNVNQPDKALIYFNKALSFKETFFKNDPNAKLLYLNLGIVYSMLNDKKKAGENFRYFMEISHNDPRLKEEAETARQKIKEISKS